MKKLNASIRMAAAVVCACAMMIMGVMSPSAVAVEAQRNAADLAADNIDVLSEGTYVVAAAAANQSLMDVSGGSANNGANVQLYHNNGTQAQRWVISKDAAGYLTFTNAQSGKVLDVNGGANRNGANVQQYAANGSPAQRWIAVGTADNFTLHSAINTNLVLDAFGGNLGDNANLQLYTANGSAAQRWSLLPADTKPEVVAKADALAQRYMGTIPEGVYGLAAASGGMLADVRGASTANGANVQLYRNNGTMAQRWMVTQDAQGYLTFTNLNSGKVLDVAGGAARNSVNVQQYDANGTRAQQWIAVGSSSGFTLHSAINVDWVLDIYGGSFANSTNIQLYQANNSAAQRWSLDTSMNMSLPIAQYRLRNAWLGAPTGASQQQTDGVSQQFAGGTVYWYESGSTVSSIQQVASDLGNELGAPTDNITVQTSYGFMKSYANGVIVATSETDGSQSFVLDGSMFAYWQSQGGAAGYLGMPTGAKTAVSRGGINGFSQRFQGGVVFSSAQTGTHSVHGDIRTSFERRGGLETVGFPMSEETGTTRSGVWQHFQNGSIYWRPNRGAFAVLNGFFDRYKSQGYENGPRGFPVSEEYNDRGHARQDFEHGSYWWDGMPGGTYTHNVQWTPQPNGYTCFPTSGYMSLRTAGINRSPVTGEETTVWNLANRMNITPAGVWNPDFTRGINQFLGTDLYHYTLYPSYDVLRNEIMNSYQTGYAPIVVEYERRGGPHPNGHFNGTFSHAIVVDSFSTTDGNVQFADPAPGYGGSAKFWTNLADFRNKYMTWTYDHDAPSIVATR